MWCTSTASERAIDNAGSRSSCHTQRHGQSSTRRKPVTGTRNNSTTQAPSVTRPTWQSKRACSHEVTVELINCCACAPLHSAPNIRVIWRRSWKAHVRAGLGRSSNQRETAAVATGEQEAAGRAPPADRVRASTWGRQPASRRRRAVHVASCSRSLLLPQHGGMYMRRRSAMNTVF
jgi:hypothetical protein